VGFASGLEGLFFVVGAAAKAFFGDACFGEFFAGKGFANALFAAEADGSRFEEPLD
jgi:hypothetical protein